MPHYIWQSNLFLIISVEPWKENTISPLSPKSPTPDGKFSCFGVTSLFCSFSIEFAKISADVQL